MPLRVPGLMYLDISVIKNLSWLTFINVAFPYMQPTYFHLIMSLHLLSFLESLYLKS